MATKVKTATYELVLMLDAAAPEEAREKLAGDTRSRIEGSGELRHAESWGVRKMAYEIEQSGEADYRFFRFETEAPNLDALRHALRIADGILRFRIFEVDPRSPLTTPPEVSFAPSRDRDGRGRGRRRDYDEDSGTEEEAATGAEPTRASEPAGESEAPAEASVETPPEPTPSAAGDERGEAPDEAPAAAEVAAEEAPAEEPAAEEPPAEEQPS